jgi:Zn-dependent M28 family amino/carboxypeptidase
MNHVRELVKLGPRPPGSSAHRSAQNYIRRRLELLGVKVEEIGFEADTPRGTVAMTNLIGKIPGESEELVVLAGHYDTVRLAGFVGANDGGSSAALLLELGRVLTQRKNRQTIWLVFFDGEEAFEKWSERDGLYGSRYQVARWREEQVLPRIRAVMVVDMIGDRDLTIRRESSSTPWLVDLIWQVAAEKGYGKQFQMDTMDTTDDHTPFLLAGVPAADLIDFNYGPGNRYWHTPQDTPDKLAPRSFEIVGDVVLGVLDRLGSRWPTRGAADAHERECRQD